MWYLQIESKMVGEIKINSFWKPGVLIGFWLEKQGKNKICKFGLKVWSVFVVIR